MYVDMFITYNSLYIICYVYTIFVKQHTHMHSINSYIQLSFLQIFGFSLLQSQIVHLLFLCGW